MMESGKTTKLMAMVFIFISKREPSTKDTGRTTCSMAPESRHTRMETSTKECSNKAKGTVKESIT